MPWPTWTTRSPSRSSRKLSITRESRRRGRPPQIGPVEQLAAAQQHDPLRHQPEAVLQRADGEVEAVFAGGLRAAEDVAEPADLGLGLADDEHLLARPGLVQLVADPVDVAAELLDRFDPQPASRFQRRRGHGGRGHRGKAEDLPQDVGNGVKGGMMNDE